MKETLLWAGMVFLLACGGEDTERRVENSERNPDSHEVGRLRLLNVTQNPMIMAFDFDMVEAYEFSIDGTDQLTKDGERCHSFRGTPDFSWKTPFSPGHHDLSVSLCDAFREPASASFDLKSLVVLAGDHLTGEYRLIPTKGLAPTAPKQGEGWLRVVQAGPDLGAIDVYVVEEVGASLAGRTPIIGNLEYGKASDYLSITRTGAEAVATREGTFDVLARGRLFWNDRSEGPNPYPIALVLNQRCEGYSCKRPPDTQPRFHSILDCMGMTCTEDGT